MPKLPVLKPQEVVSRLEALGFVQVRQRGAHKQFRHPDGRGTTVPFHKRSRLGRRNVPVDPKTNGAFACRQGVLSNA
ncbi:MAG TPA: type II toxin-antitoxin system HicA family toxin [Gemmataceae bacterium]|jgi:predicted RNA binding protein YcfA (HicA-like mRNA interferase family)|nr:type II toxin-antitoxin system HicA family toxin [Gemmataceae bacterium]